jgi:glutamate carboxypeptidase
MISSAEQADTRLPDLLADLERLVRQESPSHDLGAVAASAEVVATLGQQRLGTPAERIVIDGRTHLRWRLGTGPRKVLLLGHHDTVWPIGSLRRLPWRVDGGVARGPGCFDMKAGLAQIFHALRALPDHDGVTVLITGDEEIGSPTSRALIEEEARAVDAAFVLEASADGGALKIQRKGVSLYELTVEGRAAHAGLEPERGVNAGIELATQVLRIAELGDPDLGTTVTPTALSAGTTSNTVPSAARLAIDVRVPTVDEQRRVDQALHALRPELAGASLRLDGGPNRPPFDRASSAALFELAGRLHADLGHGELTGLAVGGASDGNFTAGVGTPTLDGLGAVGGGAHADDEHVVIDQLVPRMDLLAALVGSVLSGRWQAGGTR